jgi:hypothetical protein
MRPPNIADADCRRAQVANAFNDWLQDTLLLVSERWPMLDGNTRLDVRGLYVGCVSETQCAVRGRAR